LAVVGHYNEGDILLSTRAKSYMYLIC